MSILAIVVIIILVLNQTNIIETITNRIRNVMLAQGESAETNAYYEIVSKNEDDLEILITIENPNGIEKIVSGDTEYKCKGKQKVTLDRKMQEGEEQEYKITPVGKNEELYKIFATSKLKLIKYEKIEDTILATIESTYNSKLQVKNLYSLDKGQSWTNYGELFEVEIDANEEECVEKEVLIKNEYEDCKTIKKMPETVVKLTNRLGIINEIALGMNEEGNYEINKMDDMCNVHEYVIGGGTQIDANTAYGDDEDIGNNMILVKVNGDLTINAGKTLTAVENTNGGPKGMIIYCTGTLINNGTISMTARGANAEGQNVYLCPNEIFEYEYIPKAGMNGGIASTSSRLTIGINGHNGELGTNRRTGGGGSGAVTWGTSGAGADGTSYSGGTGGGGASGENGQPGQPNGGAGGSGRSTASSKYFSYGASGGAGNPAGAGSQIVSSNAANGTGGLLIIYAKDVINNGIISSNGSAGGSAYRAGGGGSGRRKYKYFL